MSKQNELVPERTTTPPLGHMDLGPAVRLHKSCPSFLFPPPPGLLSDSARSHRRKKVRAYSVGLRAGIQHERSARSISETYLRHHTEQTSAPAPAAQCSQSKFLPVDVAKEIDEVVGQIETNLFSIVHPASSPPPPPPPPPPPAPPPPPPGIHQMLIDELLTYDMSAAWQKLEANNEHALVVASMMAGATKEKIDAIRDSCECYEGFVHGSKMGWKLRARWRDYGMPRRKAFCG